MANQTEKSIYGKVPAALHEKLKQYAKKTGRKLTSIFSDAVREYLAKVS